MRLLIIEDEKKLADTLAELLKNKGFTVDVSYDGLDGFENGLSDIYDLIILDIMLPKINGIDVLGKLRNNNIKTPIILLTALSDVEHKVQGLNLGADDYLPKPFDMNELLARINAILRRSNNIVLDEKISFGDLYIDKQNLVLGFKSNEVKLSLKEAELMEFLILRKHAVSSKDIIIEKIWGYDSEVDYNHVEVYISFLRKKLLHINSNVVIHTVRGIGYTLKEI